MVNILSAQGSVLSEVAFNSETGCMGANTVKVGLRPLCDNPAGYPEVAAVFKLWTPRKCLQYCRQALCMFPGS